MNRRELFKTISASALALFGLGETVVTQPVSHGFPDWGRQIAASDIVIVNSLGLNLAALTQTAIFFVGNMPYLYVRISSANSANVSIAWFADAAGTVSLFGDVITTSVGGEGTQCIPVRGPYVRFTLERGAYPGTVNFQAMMVSTPFAVYAGTAGENVLINADLVAIGAGATVNFDAVATRGGHIAWNADLEGGGLFRIKLYARDFSGVSHLLDFYPASIHQTSRYLFAPALPLRVQVFNADGVARDLLMSVVHHPFGL